jgi:hypothetical protein
MTQPTGSETVRNFLKAMEARDLPRANDMLGEGFVMMFPGGVVFASLDELVAWGRERYRFVGKTYECFDELPDGSGSGLASVVYCYGTLHGEWPDGTAFEGIRFIDRFEVRDGLLRDQKVWNDLAESRAASCENGIANPG